MWKTSAALLFASVVLLVCCSSASGVVPTYEAELDVARDGEAYQAFLGEFNEHVRGTASGWVDSLHPVLGVQRLWTSPVAWHRITVRNSLAGDFFTLAIRSDNLYIVGFTNQHGEQFAFKGEAQKLPGSSTELSFQSGYRYDLFPTEGYTGLSQLYINQLVAGAHVETLANHRPGSGTDENDLKISLAFFSLIVCEAERFVPIRDAVADAWKNAFAQKIDMHVIELVVNWARISCALRAWAKYGRTQDTWSRIHEATEIRGSLGIATPADALAKTGPLLLGRRCSWT